MSVQAIRIMVSVLAIILMAGHIFAPGLKIDTITLALMVVALAPWLAPLIKSFELPGGWKIEFQELQHATVRAEAAGLLSDAVPLPNTTYSFQTISTRDPVLALAGLRIEIEKRLNQLYQQEGLGLPNRGIGYMLRELDVKGVLTAEQRSILSDMISLLNKAVHGADVDQSGAEWALDTGPRLLASLDERLGH